MKFWKNLKYVFSEGIEIFSEATMEIAASTKLNSELHQLKRAIEKNEIELGGKVYHLFIEKREANFQARASSLLETLKKLQAHFEAKVKEKAILSQGKPTIEREHLSLFRKDLELGGGAIEPIAIRANSPLVDKKLMDLHLPKSVLLGVVVRKGKVIFPDGQTVLKKDDRVTILGQSEAVKKAKIYLQEGE